MGKAVMGKVTKSASTPQRRPRRRWAIATALAVTLLGGIFAGRQIWYHIGPGRRQARLEAIERFVDAQQLIQRRRLAQAEQELRACLRVIPEHHEAVSWLVQKILYPQGRTREAAEVLAESYPHVPRPLRLTWLMLLWTTRSDDRSPDGLAENIQLLEEALAVEPVFENRLGLGFNYVVRGAPEDLRRAFPLLEQCLRERPESFEARRWLFRCLMDLQQFDQAARLAEDLPETVRDDPEFLRMRARVAMVRDERDTAVAVFRRLVEQRPADIQAHDHLGRYLKQLGRDDESADHFERAQWATNLEREAETLLLELRNFDGTTRIDSAANCYRMGEITEAMGLPREARGWYEVCLDRRPGDRQVLAALERLEHGDR
jgi:thioredoxin-like negative regulator of GroEL